MLSRGLASIVLGVQHCLMLSTNQYDVSGSMRFEHTVIIVFVVYPFTSQSQHLTFIDLETS